MVSIDQPILDIFRIFKALSLTLQSFFEKPKSDLRSKHLAKVLNLLFFCTF